MLPLLNYIVFNYKNKTNTQQKLLSRSRQFFNSCFTQNKTQKKKSFQWWIFWRWKTHRNEGNGGRSKLKLRLLALMEDFARASVCQPVLSLYSNKRSILSSWKDREYLVHWRGFSPYECSWEPESNVTSNCIK